MNQNKMEMVEVGEIYVYKIHFGPGTTMSCELGTIGVHVRSRKFSYDNIIKKYFA